MNKAQLSKFCTSAEEYYDWIVRAIQLYQISPGHRFNMWISQCFHETRGFSRMEESLYYTHADHLWSVFKSKFDLDHDKVMDPDEIARAETYLKDSKKLASLVYANRFGNRDEASGDGWAYRGRGGLGLTFYDNYFAASMGIYNDDRLVRYPDKVAEPEGAMLTAGWFWYKNGCNEAADSGQIDKTTRIINPGMAGAAEREEIYGRAVEVFT